MEPINIENIKVAERKFIENKKYRIFKILISTFTILGFILLMFFLRKSNLNSYQNGLIGDVKIKDDKILGHFPYSETSLENLVEITPDILVHKKMYKSPAGAPRKPACPSSPSLIRVPSSTPAGIVTASFFSF